MRRALVGAALALSVVVLGLALPTLDVFQQRLSAYGPGDEDVSLVLSVARRDLGFEVLNTAVGAETLRGLRDESGTVVYAAFGVERGFTASETQAILDFVASGGHALILDDFGRSGGLLGRFGVGLTTGPLLETQPEPSANVRVTLLGHEVTLVRPAAYILPGNASALGVEVLARTSNSVVLDLDGDGRVDETDPPDAYPVAVRIQHGRGEILAVADPTFVTNAVLASQNAGLAFLRDYLLGTLPESAGAATLVVDESRHVRGMGELIAATVRVPAGVLARPAVLAAVLALHTVLAALALRRFRDEAPAPHEPGLDKPYWPAPTGSTMERLRNALNGRGRN